MTLDKMKKVGYAKLFFVAFLAGCSDSQLQSADIVIADQSSSSEKEVYSSSEIADETVEQSSSSAIISVDSLENEISSCSFNLISSSSEAESSSSSIVYIAKDVIVKAYQYEFAGMDFLNLNIYNNENVDIDSLTLRLYVTATPSEIEVVAGENNSPGSCPVLIDEDICQVYDEAGFNKTCGTDDLLRTDFRHSFPTKLDDPYDSVSGTYIWYIPVPLNTTFPSKRRVRIDIGFSSGIYQSGACETLRTPAKKRFTSSSNDWSFQPHSLETDGADYAGMPIEDKDFGDKIDEVTINPYIVIYRNDEYISGYGPNGIGR